MNVTGVTLVGEGRKFGQSHLVRFFPSLSHLGNEARGQLLGGAKLDFLRNWLYLWLYHMRLSCCFWPRSVD